MEVVPLRDGIDLKYTQIATGVIVLTSGKNNHAHCASLRNQMRNQAKCRLCSSIIESLHPTDLVVCKCGEISIDGGQDAFIAYAKNWDSFLRVDDQGNEIVIKVIDKDEVSHDTPEISTSVEPKPITKEEKIQMLAEMCNSIENLPPQAMWTAVNQYDLYNALALIVSILKS